MTRSPRVNNIPKDDDPQTQLEVEMASSGRTAAVPREGLVGAHTARRETSADADGAEQEPTGFASDVAPTKLAQERERERHRLERESGRTPAGQDGLIRDKRAPGTTREALDAAARQADRNVVGHEIPRRS
jgi:hypothetical protein